MLGANDGMHLPMIEGADVYALVTLRSSGDTAVRRCSSSEQESVLEQQLAQLCETVAHWHSAAQCNRDAQPRSPSGPSARRIGELSPG